MSKVIKITDLKRKSKFDEAMVEVQLTCSHDVLCYADVDVEVDDEVRCEICIELNSVVKGLTNVKQDGSFRS